MSKRINRRELLRNTTFASVAVVVSRGVVGAESRSPNEKLNLAFVGAGGRGEANIGMLEDKGVNIVALCDVDEERAARTFEAYPDVPKFQDYRKMLEKMEKQIDAVVVSAPNHIHAPASATALRLGKHVYCEKPLSHSVYESRVLAQLAAEKKVATQMGTQYHGSHRHLVEILRSGVIGPIREVDICFQVQAGLEPTKAFAAKYKDRHTDTPPVPATLNWEMWIGPAPIRPYHPSYLPRSWHYWWDFGGGELLNNGIHSFDMPFWALDLRHPKTIEVEGPPVHAERTPGAMIIKYEFAARGDMPPVKMTWYQGLESPRVKDLNLKVSLGATHYLFVGDKGMMATGGGKRILLPEDTFADYQPPPPSTSGPDGNHWTQWVTACKTGSATGCPFDSSGPMTETLLLGNVAFRAGKKIEWDAANLKVTNCPEAQQFVRRAYRDGWTL